MRLSAIGLAGLFGALLLAASGSAAAQPAPPSGGDCAPGARLKFICGLKSPEDLVQVPGTDWIIVSGLGDAANPATPTDTGGELALIDPAARTGRKLAFTGGAPRAPYGDCAAAPDPARLLTHGLNILPAGRGKARLFVVGHGGREAIEVFEVASGKGPPNLTWIGCVKPPADAFDNSVVALKDGRVVFTDFLHKPSTFRDLLSGKVTGAVYVWTPGGTARKLPGTDLPGANGVEASADGRYVFVAVSGTAKVLRYELAATEKPPTVIDPGLR
ncbi:MAG TPA: hypothetical protein VGC92_16175, partial [Phenylobacterium sp.]